MQRRAIESLREKVEKQPPSTVAVAQLVLYGGAPLYRLGVSEGYGTCSDIHGMDVLVVGECPPSDVRNLYGKEDFAYIVLLRGVTEQERRDYYQRYNEGVALACVELLYASTVEPDIIVLSRKGEKKIYVNLI